MGSLYNFSDFVDSLDWLLKQQKLNYRQVSLRTDIHPSYFSRVMKRNASFSQLQIFRITKVINLGTEEADFLYLLWSLFNSQSRDEKDFFRARIRTQQDKHLRVAEKINIPVLSLEEKKAQIESYYSEAITALTHMYLTIPEYQKNPRKILSQITLSEAKLNTELKKLEELLLIKRVGEQITQVQDSIHLDEKSSLSFRNHINWRLKCIQNLENHSSQESDYHLSVVFSSNKEVKHQLKQALRDVVVRAQKLVSQDNSPSEVYHLMMDLF